MRQGGAIQDIHRSSPDALVDKPKAARKGAKKMPRTRGRRPGLRGRVGKVVNLFVGFGAVFPAVSQPPAAGGPTLCLSSRVSTSRQHVSFPSRMTNAPPAR